MRRRPKWVVVAGARPNFVKIAPLMKEILRIGGAQGARGIRPLLVHTGQHYDRNLSGMFFEDLGIPVPDINLGVGSGGHGDQTGRVMIGFEAVVERERPDIIIVVGDVNSTLACALVGAKLGVRVAHIEAGLRSFDRRMPEEINRVLTDHLSDFLFTPCVEADRNLLNEGISPELLFRVGNILADSLAMIMPTVQRSAAPVLLEEATGLKQRDYALLTLHRPSNVDDPGMLSNLLSSIRSISESMPVVFPVHPRTAKRMEEFGLQWACSRLDDSFRPYGPAGRGRVYAVPALGYPDFIALLRGAAMAFTDSGGVQEETSMLGVPCITLRETTEWTVTVASGANILAGCGDGSVRGAYESALKGMGKAASLPEFWDGRASERIVGILAERS